MGSLSGSRAWWVNSKSIKNIIKSICKKIKVKMELEKKFLCYIKLDLTQFNSKPKPYKARVKRYQLLDLIFSSR